MKEKQTMEDSQNEIQVNLQQIKESEVRIDRFLIYDLNTIIIIIYFFNNLFFLLLKQ